MPAHLTQVRKLLTGTALIGVALSLSSPAFAACSNNAPPSMTFVICNGLDTAGVINPAAESVFLQINSGASIVTAGNSIHLSSGALTMAAGAGTRIESTGGNAITMSNNLTSMFVTVGSLAEVVGTISLNGIGSQTIIVDGTVGNVNMTGSSAGSVQGFALGGAGTVTGTVTTDATAGINHILLLYGTTNGAFNSADIGTKYLNFDSFRKQDASTWTLSGANAVTWDITGGTLVGTTSNIGAITSTGTSVLRFDQAGSGTNSSVLAGTITVEKAGTGQITLSGANTYTGGTVINSGFLIVNAANNLGAVASDVTIDGGASLGFSGAYTDPHDFILSGGDAGFVHAPAANVTLSGVVSGAGRLVKTGFATLTLGNTNTYTGGTAITGVGSIIAVANDAGLGGAGDVDLSNSGTLQFNSSFSTSRDINLTANDGVVRTSGGANATLDGAISGVGRLVFGAAAGGTFTLSNTNTYQGGTVVGGTNSVLAVSADDNLGDAGGSILLSGTTAPTLRYLASFDSARDLIIGGVGGAIFDTNNFDSTLSGDLSGISLFTKAGNGILRLSGGSTKTGGFAVTGGILIGNTDNLTGNIANSGLLVFDQATDATYAGVISGNGNFIKDGAGNLILSGVNTYNGTTTVSGGRLAVNGSVANSSFIVDGVGNLGGSGTIGDLLMNGTLSPGNSIGTLNAGNTNFTAGSVYEVEFNDALASDLLAITGTLDIQPGVTVNTYADPGIYADGSLYTIITHTGLRTGTFDTITTDLAFFNPSLIYNANSVQMLLSRNNVSFPDVAEDEVQQDVAESLEEIGAGNDLYDAFLSSTRAQAVTALDALSGEHIPGVAGTLGEATGILRNVLTTRMQALSHHHSEGNSAALAPLQWNDSGMTSVVTAAFLDPEANSAPVRNAESHFWIETFGTTGHTNGRRTSSQQDRGSSGLIAGVDRAFGENTYIGVFGGYEDAELNTYSERAVSEIDNYHAGIYASHSFEGGFRINGGLGGTYHDINSKRYVAFGAFSEDPEGDTTAYTATGFIEASHQFEFSNDVAIEPFMNVSVTYSHMNGYEEKNGGSASLTIDDVNTVTPAHVLGLRAGKTVTTEAGTELRLNGTLGWQHSYGDMEDKSSMSFSSGGSKFITYGPGRTRDVALVGLGVDAKMGEGLNLYGGYNGALSVDSRDHAFVAGVKWSF